MNKLAPATMPNSQLFCSHCGTQQPSTNKFCIQCGNNLHNATTQQNAPIQIYNTFGAGNTTPLIVPQQKPSEENQETTLLSTLSIAFSILGLLCCWLAWIGMLLAAGGIGCGVGAWKSGRGTTGIVIGAIGFVLSFIFFLIYWEIID